MKTSNKIAISAVIILAVLPAISFFLNKHAASRCKSDITECLRAMCSDTVRVVCYQGPKATPGLLYVRSLRHRFGSCINLNIEPEVSLKGDTLSIVTDDPSAIYQGTIRLLNLCEARLNDTVISFRPMKKLATDSIPADTLPAAHSEHKTIK